MCYRILPLRTSVVYDGIEVESKGTAGYLRPARNGCGSTMHATALLHGKLQQPDGAS